MELDIDFRVMGNSWIFTLEMLEMLALEICYFNGDEGWRGSGCMRCLETLWMKPKYALGNDYLLKQIS